MKEKPSTELIERYVAAVGRQLPRRLRDDVEAELRSTLLDMVEDQSREQDRVPDAALTAELLQEMDPPEQMAAKYMGDQYLIGPRFYPLFILLTKVLLVIMLAGQAIGILVALSWSNEGNSWSTLGGWLSSLPASVLGTVGMLVVIFAVLERVIPETAERAEKPWNPRKLPAVNSPDLVRPAGIVVRIVLTIAAIVVLNFYQDWVGGNFFRDGEWHHFSILTPAFSRYLLAINVLAGLNILLDLALLRQGEWRLWRRWAKVVLIFSGIVLLFAMLDGESILRISPELGSPIDGLDMSLDILLVLVLIRQGVDLARQSLQLWRMRGGPVLQIPLRQDHRGEGD